MILFKEMKIRYSAQLIIAALNEEPGIGLTIAEMKDALVDLKVLVVDGKSSDRTVEIAEELGAKVIFQDGSGKGDALAKGLKNADLNVDYVVFTDADYTYPASFVPKMLEILGGIPYVGMVCGNRFSGYLDLKGLNGIFYFGNRLISFIHNLVNGIQLTDPLTGLRVVRIRI